ncbi:hypothetical protein Peur_064334 [Populus x canadensis]|jgi:small subunit ribosomal protein S4e
MLDKLGGAFAPKPSSRPHKSRECLPLILILRNRLKYALTYHEVIAILMQRQVLVDGKVMTDKTNPSVSWMLCQSQRQTRASVASVTPKAASGSTI